MNPKILIIVLSMCLFLVGSAYANPIGYTHILNITSINSIISVPFGTNTLSITNSSWLFLPFSVNSILENQASPYAVLFMGHENTTISKNLNYYVFGDGYLLNYSGMKNISLYFDPNLTSAFNISQSLNPKIYEANFGAGSIMSYGISNSNLTSEILTTKIISNISGTFDFWTNTQNIELSPQNPFTQGLNLSYVDQSLGIGGQHTNLQISPYNLNGIAYENLNLTNFGTFGKRSVLGISNASYNLYLTPHYSILLNDTLLSTNHIANTLINQSLGIGVFAQGYSNEFTFNFNPSTPYQNNNNNYLLYPIYTTTYNTLINSFNAIIVPPIIATNISIHWNYALPVHVSAWQYNFTTLPLFPFNTNYPKTHSIIYPSNYTILNIPTYLQFGNMSNPQIKVVESASNKNYTMPTSILAYNNSETTLVIESNSSIAKENNFTILINNSFGQSFITPLNDLNFQRVVSGAGTINSSILQEYPIFRINAIPLPSSDIEYLFSAYAVYLTFTYPNLNTLQANLPSVASKTFVYGIPNVALNDNPLVLTKNAGLISDAASSTTFYINSTDYSVAKNGAVGGANGVAYNLSSLINLTLRKPFNTNYTLGKPYLLTTNQQKSGKSNLNNIVPTTSGLNSSNFALINNTNISANLNVVLNANNLLSLKNFFGVEVPYLVFVFVAIISITIAFLVSSEGGQNVGIMVLIFVWLAGLIDIDVSILAVIVSIIYIIYKLETL